MIVYSSLCLTIPVLGMVVISYIYWQHKQEQEHYLLQQNALNFCLQDLDNSIFYSRVSELSNLSIIRNELYRIYNIVDLSARYTHIDELKAAESYNRSILIAPSPSPSSATMANDSYEIEDEDDNNSTEELLDDDVVSNEYESEINNVAAASALGDASSLQDSTQPVKSEHNEKEPLYNQNYLNDLKEAASLLDGTTGASVLSALNKAYQEESLNKEDPISTDTDKTPLLKENRNYYSTNQNYQLVNIKRKPEESPNKANNIVDNPLSNEVPAYQRPDAASIHELKTTYAMRLNDVMTTKNQGNRYNNGFRTTLNPPNNNNDHLLGANFKDLNSNRIKVFNQIAMLNQLGFIAFSVNLKDPALDIFVKSRDRLLLSMLKNEGRNLNSILYNNEHPTNTFFVVLKDNLDTETLSTHKENKLHNRFIRHIASSQFDTNIAITKAQESTVDNADIEEEEEEHIIINDTKEEKVLSADLDETFSAQNKTYLAIVAPLSLSKDQYIIIINDISKLKQQEETLKRLIANSLNEMVLSNSITQPINITLVNEDLNPLAGSLTTTKEVSAIVDKDLLQEAKIKGTIQFYDSASKQYISIGTFKHYNWFVIINSNNQRVLSNLYHFLGLVALTGLLFAMLAVFLVGQLTARDASDISIIYNKIKHLATLIQDPILLQRICNGLPKREDEIGALSSHVRLMAKTVYQSIQEILQINKARDLDEVERNIIEQWRHSAINRQVLLRESYHTYFNVYSEIVSINKNCDFYDIFELKDNRLAIFIGSINESSLMDANNIAIINIALFRQMIRLSESIKLPLARAMHELNNNIAANNPKSIMTSLCIVIVDRKNGEVEYFNAGHNLPILYSKDNGFDYIECHTAPLLGAYTEQSFKSMYFTMQPGDSILLYTDGVLNCRNHKNELLGQNGFENMLHDETFISPVETVNNINAKLKRYIKEQKPTRDYTLLCYQYQRHQAQHD